MKIKNNSLLEEEYIKIEHILYKYKNRFRAQMFYRVLYKLYKQLHRYIKNDTSSIFKPTDTDILSTIRRLFEITTSNIPDGYFLNLTLLIISISCRLHDYFLTVSKKDEIDEIFEDFL